MGVHFSPSPQPEGQGSVTSQEGAQAVTPAVPSVFGFGACPSGGTAVDSSSGWRERTGAVDPAAPPPWPAGPVPSTSGPRLPSPRLGWEAGRTGLLLEVTVPAAVAPRWPGRSRGKMQSPAFRLFSPRATAASQPLPKAGRCCPQQSPLILSQGGTRVTWSLAAARPATPSAGRGRGCKPGTGNGAFLVPATAGSEKGPWELQGR